MSGVKHTPGPWAVDHNAGSIFHAASGARIAFVGRVSSGVSGLETDANERLIAAAPEMLEALREMADEWLESPIGSAKGLERYTRAKAAIAKAEGVQS